MGEKSNNDNLLFALQLHYYGVITVQTQGETGKLTNAYDYGVQRNAVSTVTGNDNGHVRNTYYYNYDGRGSVSMLTGANGAVGVAYRYGANGETTIVRRRHR